MANQKVITLYEGDTTPQNVVLRELPLADIPSGIAIYLYSASSPAGLSGDPRVITLYEGDATPQNIVLRSLSAYTIAPPEAIIILRNPLLAESGSGITYFGILKRWSGSIWGKEPLKMYLAGSWQSKKLKRYDSSEWKIIDTSGV